eukprot:986068-Pleurochrysis_carterae.AAC.6
MMYKCGHSVVTLPSDEGDDTSLLQNNMNSANHQPFPRHEPTMPGFDPRAPTATCSKKSCRVTITTTRSTPQNCGILDFQDVGHAVQCPPGL